MATAPADGYTIGSFVIGVPVVGHKIGIPELAPEQFDPLGIFLTYPFVLAAAKDAPFDSLQEMAEYGKSNELVLGHFGAPLIPTRVSLAYARIAGFEWGSNAAFDMLDCNSLASGDADVIDTTLQLVLPCIDDVKILASHANHGGSTRHVPCPTGAGLSCSARKARQNGHRAASFTDRHGI